MERETTISYDLAKKAADALIGLADVTAVFGSGKEILLKGQPLQKLNGLTNLIESRLSHLGYKTEVLSTEPSLVVRMKSREAFRRRNFPLTNLLLFVVTILTTLLAGALMDGVDIFANPAVILGQPLKVLFAGLPFSASLLAILLFHEFGHYTAARIHKVDVTLPYFIPAPTIIGTFGAFIRSKSAFMNRRQLLDVAATGPLAGLLVSIVVLFIGIDNSVLAPIQQASGGMYLGESLLHKLIIYIVKGPIPDGQALMVSSVAFAGWVGLLVTMFNLLPIGQLDGGHIIYALFGRQQKYLAYAAMVGLLVLSFWWTGWAFWLILTLLIKPEHPPTLIDEVDIGRRRRVMGYFSIVAFIICFIPIPVSYT